MKIEMFVNKDTGEGVSVDEVLDVLREARFDAETDSRLADEDSFFDYYSESLGIAIRSIEFLKRSLDITIRWAVWASVIVIVQAIINCAFVFNAFGQVPCPEKTYTFTPDVTATDIAKHTIYSGTGSRDYRSKTDIGLSTLFKLAPCGKFFAVTSTDKSGNESAYSNELEGVAPQAPKDLRQTENP